MPEEPSELPTHPQKSQLEAPSLVDKLKIHKRRFLSGLLALFILTGVTFGIYQLVKDQPQPTATPPPAQTPTSFPRPQLEPAYPTDETVGWETYEGQSTYYLGSNEGKFSFRYPASCGLTERKNRIGYGNLVSCIGEDYKFVIDPYASPGGECYEERCQLDYVKLGEITWQKAFFKDVKVAFYTPSFEEVGNLSFLFTVNHSQYSKQGENLAEEILSTFQVLD